MVLWVEDPPFVDLCGIFWTSSLIVNYQQPTYYLGVVLGISFFITPRSHPQLAVGVNIHVPNQVAAIFVKVSCDISDLDLREWTTAIISVTAWIATGPWFW